ncbi:hypothetical protein L9059_30295 [Pseudomonas sp. TNT19]|uniref:Prophage PSSB64-01 n=1 Tax=Pseudomonas violetae TaxID=2915813 RepID=A0ABT0F8Q0_9PSED|nr:hypothetical protein [Pseudomonas violetae]MCK1794393.1 hypothetical protein [Pseudomonas violetae]
MGQLMALTNRWLPGAEPTIENMGTAKWLEDEYWKRMEFAVANGISHAFNG